MRSGCAPSSRALRPSSIPPSRPTCPTGYRYRLGEAYGDDERALLARAWQAPAPLDLRVNPLKTNRDAARAALAASGIEAKATPFSPLGLRVSGRPVLARHPLLLDGSLEVQDESSQLVGYLVAPKRTDMVVDFCAGAGGKTLLLGALMRSHGRLYAFDIIERRLANLKPRVARSGLSNVHPQLLASERDAKIKRLAGEIDRVLVDAPCTGFGTLRRNPDLKWRHAETAVAELARKQHAILMAAATLARETGRPARLRDMQRIARGERGGRRCVPRGASAIRGRQCRRGIRPCRHRTRHGSDAEASSAPSWMRRILCRSVGKNVAQIRRHSRERGNPVSCIESRWVPASAGTTGRGNHADFGTTCAAATDDCQPRIPVDFRGAHPGRSQPLRIRAGDTRGMDRPRTGRRLRRCRLVARSPGESQVRVQRNRRASRPWRCEPAVAAVDDIRAAARRRCSVPGAGSRRSSFRSRCR